MKTQTRLIVVASLASAAASCELPPDNQGQAVRENTSALTSCTGEWSVVDSPNAGSGDNSLASVTGSSPDDVWAVGQFAPDADPNITLTLAEHFDGQAWSVIETPNVGTDHGNALLAVTSQPGAAWAVGYYIGKDYLSHALIEHWDGHHWNIVPHPSCFETDNLYGVTSVSSNDVWAVGSGRDGEGAFQTVALHFDGHDWASVPPLNPGTTGNVLYSVIGNGPNDVWAVGQRMGDAPPDEALVEHWDGKRWSVAAAHAPAGTSTQLLAADIRAGDDLRAAGDSQDGAVSLRTFAISGEHGALSVQGTPDPNVGDNRLTGVAAVDDHESWAVGSTLDDATGSLSTLIVGGGETAPWTRVPSPNPSSDGDNQLSTVTKVGRRNLWAVGGYDGPDAQQTLILLRCK